VTVIPTRGRALTAEDFEGDLPAPGSSDKRYSKEFLDAVAMLIVAVTELSRLVETDAGPD
jgi:hypothetical protein